MKNNRMQWMILAVCCVVMASGCTKSNIVLPDPEEYQKPDYSLYNNIELDEEQLQEELDDIYTDPDDYPMASSIGFDLNLDEEYIDIDVVVKDDTKSEDAQWYAGEAIKALNDLVADQDLNYGKSGEDTFGGLYQDNVIRLRVYKESAYAAGGDPVYQTEVPKDTFMTFEFNME